MATQASSSGARNKRAPNGSSRPKRKPKPRAKSAATSRSTTARKRPARKSPPRQPAASQNGSGVLSSVKGPAVAIGATAAAVAGALVMKGTRRQKTILGVPVPRKVPSVDVKQVAKAVGKASRQLAETSKSVSKDIERVGEQAERLGRILG
jgi:hypothetical protein